jgi:cell division protein FtsA
MSQSPSEMLFGVEIGRHAVRAIAGYAGAHGAEIVGAGSCPTWGVGIDGSVTSTADLAASLRTALSEAEAAAEATATRVQLALPGCLAQTTKAFGRIGLRGRPAAAKDLERLREEVLGEITAGQHIFESRLLSIGLTDAFSSDGSIELGATYLVLAAKRAILDLHLHAAALAGFEVAGSVPGPLAAADAVLTPAEKQHGVILLHLEDCFIDVCVFQGGALQHMSTVSIARLADELAKLGGRDSVLPSQLIVTGEAVEGQEAALAAVPAVCARRSEPEGLPPELTVGMGLLLRGAAEPGNEKLRAPQLK